MDAKQNPDLKTLMAVMDVFSVVQSGGRTSLLISVDLFATLDADSDRERLLKDKARLHNDSIKVVQHLCGCI